jgi:hypothetical protein
MERFAFRARLAGACRSFVLGPLRRNSVLLPAGGSLRVRACIDFRHYAEILSSEGDAVGVSAQTHHVGGARKRRPRPPRVPLTGSVSASCRDPSPGPHRPAGAGRPQRVAPPGFASTLCLRFRLAEAINLAADRPAAARSLGTRLPVRRFASAMIDLLPAIIRQIGIDFPLP